jgi:hypothetical protein
VDYIVRAALGEETNEGWVWICGPSSAHLDSRTIVSIERPGHNYRVYAEVRKIDGNFCQRYNASPRISVDCEDDTIVMAWWYRRALAIQDITKHDNRTDRVSLKVKEAKIWGWRSLRAACHHPDPVVRLGTRLGVLGAWLGLLGVWLGVIGLCPMSTMSHQVGLGLLVVVGVAGFRATWGLPRRRLR